MRVIRLFRLAAAMAATLALPAGAVQGTPRNLPATVEIAHNCTCYAANHRYAQGSIACIKGRRLKCGMNQNVSSWIALEGQCQPSEVSDAAGKLPHTPAPASIDFTPL